MKKSELRKLIKEAVAAQPKISGDVIAAEKSIDNNPTTSKALLKYDAAVEIYQGFTEWIQNLGITPPGTKVQGKKLMTKATIVAAVNKALADLNWK